MSNLPIAVYFVSFFLTFFITFVFIFLLGTEFKAIICAILGVLLAMEIQRGKGGMKNKEYNSQIGATASCTLRLAKAVHPVVEGEPARGMSRCRCMVRLGSLCSSLGQRRIQNCPSGQVQQWLLSKELH